MIARPPDFSTAAATASESVATTASPIWAARARRSTCTIIGNPWMSASGLPGRRGGAQRGGSRGTGGGPWLPPRLYGLPDRRQNGICPPPSGTPTAIRLTPTRAPSGSPFFDEFVRVEQNPWRHPRHLPSDACAQYRRQRDLCTREADQGRLRDRRQGNGRGWSERAEGAGATDRDAARFRLRRAGPGDGQAVPSVPYLPEG